MPKTLPSLLLWLATATVTTVQAQTEVIPLPLSGPAYQLAQQAYQAAARGDYRLAQARLHEAIRLRPDAPELRRQLRQIRTLERDSLAQRRQVRDPGYRDASAAYRAYRDKDYPQAASLARRAVAASPGNDAYWLLLGNILIEAGQLDDAATVLAQGAGSVSEGSALRHRQLDLQRERAAMQGAAVLRAQENGDAPAELEAARRAVELAPQELRYRLMLVIALLHNGRLADAQAAADDAHARDEWQAGPLLLRAYARLRLGQADAARADLDRARALARPDEQLAVRLLQADAGLALQDPPAAQAAVSDIDEAATTDATQLAQLRQTRQRIRQAQRARHRVALTHDVTAPRPLSEREFPTPALDCNTDGAENRNACRVVPGAAPRDAGYQEATQAYQAMQEQQYQDAVGHANAAVALAPANPDYRQLQIDALQAAGRSREAEQAITALLAQDHANAGPLLARRAALRERLGEPAAARADAQAALAQGDLPLDTEIGLLARTGRQAQARQVFLAGRDDGAFDDLDDLQLAYLAAQAGENGTAQQAFTRADAAGKLPDTSLADAGYAAVHAGDDAAALDWLGRSVQAGDDGRLAGSDQQRFDTRRSISTIDRSGGLIASLSRSGGGPSAGNGGRPGASGSDSTVQTGVEAYWRPFGYQDGRPVELFGRVFQTLDDQSGGPTGPQTAQATVGARWKPLADHNLVLSLGRLVPLGAQSGADWLAQLAYSDGTGTDLRVDRPSWWTTQWYGEAGRYLRHTQTYALASAQAGRSYRLDGIDPQLVLFPHVTLNGDYNSLNGNKTAFGMGPGLNLRYWFRADQTHAPRSYLDLSLQYRVRIGGDERAQGWFLGATLSY